MVKSSFWRPAAEVCRIIHEKGAVAIAPHPFDRFRAGIRRSRLDEMDVDATRINCLVANHVTGAMIPLHYRTDREVLDAALSTVGLTQPADVRLMWIKNTLQLAELYCSPAYLAEAKPREDLELVEEPTELTFDQDGYLTIPTSW